MLQLRLSCNLVLVSLQSSINPSIHFRPLICYWVAGAAAATQITVHCTKPPKPSCGW